jgi:4-amino-4-deoxy-L-arabinose transferase-like glycosyltransferase
MGAVMWMSGNKPWAAALLGPAASALALPIVWCLARRMVDAGRALIAVFLLEGIIYFNFASVDFNHNVILLPLWAFISYTAHRAYREGKLTDWALLGLAAALGLLGKYATALFLAAVVAAFVADREGRAKLGSMGPFIALICGTAILAPHLWGLYKIDFAPFKYAGERLQSAASPSDHVRFPLCWLAAQMVNTALAICLAGALLPPRRLRTFTRNPAPPRAFGPFFWRDLRFVVILFAGPLLVGVAIQALGGVRFRDMWGFPMFCLLGVLAALLTVGLPLRQDVLPKLAVATMAALALAMTAIAGVSVASPYVTKKGPRHLFPAPEMAKAMASQWASLTGSMPLRYVVADIWLGGMLSAYHPDHPSVLISGCFETSPWVTPAGIEQSGAVLVWTSDQEDQKMLKQFPGAIRQDSLQLPYKTEAPVQEARLSWAILPPLNSPSIATKENGNALR